MAAQNVDLACHEALSINLLPPIYLLPLYRRKGPCPICGCEECSQLLALIGGLNNCQLLRAETVVFFTRIPCQRMMSWRCITARFIGLIIKVP